MAGKPGLRTFGNMRRLPSGRVQAKYKGPDGRTHTAPYTFQAKRDADAWLSREWGKIQDRTWEPPKTREVVRVEKVTTHVRQVRGGGHQPTAGRRQEQGDHGALSKADAPLPGGEIR